MSQMQADTPWITIFDNNSQHAQGAKFQMSYVDADAQGHPEINLVCVGIEADQTITQVLFFKVTDQSATIRRLAPSSASQCSGRIPPGSR